MRIAQINIVASLSTGRIAVQLCRMAQQAGHKAIICHSRDYAPSDVISFRVGTRVPVPKGPSKPKRERKNRIARFWGLLKAICLKQLDKAALRFPWLRKVIRAPRPQRKEPVKPTARQPSCLTLRADNARCWLNTHFHWLFARLTDRTGFFSKRATQNLVRQLELFRPDVIHLHNIHGYYLHLPTLFAYLKTNDIPVVWTMHDCWAYTGHCAYYTMAQDAPPIGPVKKRRARQHTVGCDRWKAGCGQCVLRRSYPASWLVDRSAKNWKEKRDLFCGVKHMVLTTPSEWLRDEIKQSFLKDYPVYVFPNGVDLNVFQPCASDEYMRQAAISYGLDRIGERKLVLSAAAVWDERKGLDDLIELAEKLGPEYCVAAVGLDARQIEFLPKNTVMGIRRTGNVNDLCALYTAADVYVSASHEETFGMTLIEAMACGTQVVCYDATAMPELVTEDVGEVVPVGDTDAMADAVRRLCDQPKPKQQCQARAAEYELQERFKAYLRLYEKIYRHKSAWQKAQNAGGETN